MNAAYDIVSIKRHTGTSEWGSPIYSEDFPDKGFFHSWVVLGEGYVNAIIVMQDGTAQSFPIWQIRFDTLNGKPR